MGVDGLICINWVDGFDFEVDYYNVDGMKSFCGNGVCCFVVFVYWLGLIVEIVFFLVIDGLYFVSMFYGIVLLKMLDIF